PSSCVLSPSVAHRVLHSFPTRRSSDLEIHMAVFLFLAGQPSRNAEARLLGAPIQDSEHADGLTSIAPKRPDPGITGDTVPLHIIDRKSTRLNSSHVKISYAVFCLKKKK